MTRIKHNWFISNRISSGEEIRFLAVLLVLTVVIKLAFFFWGGVEPFQGRDSYSFYSLATNYAQGEGLVYVDNGTPDMVFKSFRPPLYPFVMGLIFRATGESPTVIILLQLLIGTASVLLLYAAGKLLFDISVARWASFLGALYWVSSFYDNQIYTETLFVFLFLAANALVFSIARQNDRSSMLWRAVLSGIVYGTAILCRPAAVATLPLILLWLLFTGRASRKLLCMSAGLAVTGTAMVMIPWWIRNFVIHHTFVPFVTSGGLNFWGGNQIDGGSNSIARAWQIMNANIQRLSEVGWDRWFYHDAFEKIRANPAHFVSMIKLKLNMFWWPLRNEFYQLPYRFLFPFFMLGIGSAIGYLRSSSALFLIVVSQTAVAALYAAHSRYRYSIDFYMILLAAVAILELLRYGMRGRRLNGRVILASILCLEFVFWKLEPVVLPFIKVWFVVPAGIALMASGYFLWKDNDRRAQTNSTSPRIH
jgi:4-amino-4-deoxy-L-arabinose transferase-like glycosyltransferase